MTRVLAHIERVVSVSPIPKADKIEVATILGWHVVVKKGDVKPGDLVVYFEIDSFLPIESRYEFLRASSFKTMDVDDGNGLVTTIEGFRLRTIKLRGQISQGLVLPLSEFPELGTESYGTDLDDSFMGIDVTTQLNVRLYEPPIPANMRSAVKGGFPRKIKKTDQERIQNHPEYFEMYKDVEFEVTEKVDGTSVTIFIDGDDELNVCSRNLNLKDGDNIYWSTIKETNIHGFLHINKNIAIQAEIVGESVCKNPLGLKGRRVFAFDVWDIEKQRYLTPAERHLALREVVFETISLMHVPIVHMTFKPFTIYTSMDELIASAKGTSLVNPGREREGLVFKSRELINGQVLSFKVIDNQLLLKADDDDEWMNEAKKER